MAQRNPLQPVSIEDVFGAGFDLEQPLTTRVAANMMLKLANFFVTSERQPNRPHGAEQQQGQQQPVIVKWFRERSKV